ncbi:hypothetical protein Ait01nite_089500 [Actinoplanes italicus]|uniref:Uncharacterized protein n=1 Tax=Actinoplanes italicus TaxID=113567 RepID=A0A2T0JIF7_9ACTN|nr:hypothetical protein [Actinoplanes italicus]PRX07366.1 hypothetical protein CLV67_14241 [Actinoplanes italicus]GIE35905.1 hypothetical protein Ait01nite_089500 [Actinoplanes italicus]
MADMLITPAELASALQVDEVDTASATLVIELATGKVQAAAGQRLVAAVSTFVIDVDPCDYGPWLTIPQLPVRSVGAVLIDGVTYTDWLLRSQRLWRRNGWISRLDQPTQVTVQDVAHGYLDGSQALQPARGIVLGLSMVGYGNPGGAISESIDDYKVTYAEADARMQVTDSMRDLLIAAYGGGAHVTTSR